MKGIWVVLAFLLFIFLAMICSQTAPDGGAPYQPATLAAPYVPAAPDAILTPGFTPMPLSDLLATLLPPTRLPGAALPSPTPDAPRRLPTLRSQPETYVVQPNDSLALIARRYGVSLNDVIQANHISDPNLLAVGQSLTIPAPVPDGVAPAFKIIPDSELVAGPASAALDLETFIRQQGGYLSRYQEEVDGLPLSGAQILARVASENSVNPRLLLALLQRQGGWVNGPDPQTVQQEYPMSYYDPTRKGLYRQLSWAANNLNRGYYLWKINALSHWILTDNTLLTLDPGLNAGSAAVQYLFSLFYAYPEWQQAVGPAGLQATYTQFFGSPFDLAIEPLLPTGLQQPPMQLPFESGPAWSFTGGPHGGWGDGTAWAALDFAPPDTAGGCVSSDAWVTAPAAGRIARAENGIVILDLDGDGYEQTGWVVFYLHIETRQRVSAGAFVRAGEHIGHASCEGGVSNGTHVHIARRYNGEWISADGALPFNLDGWISEGSGIEYNGILRRDGRVVEAWDSRKTENQIQR